MNTTIGSLFFKFGANTKNLDDAMARIEADEIKLADLREKNADRLQDINDELATKTYEYSQAQIRLEKAVAQSNAAAAKRAQTQLQKLDVALEKLDTDRTRFAERAKRAEDKLTKSIETQRASYSKLGQVLKTIRSSMFAISGAVGGVLSVSAFNNVVDKLDSIAKRARDIGITASQLQELGHQANLAGVSAERLDVSIRSFRRNISLAAMGTGEARKAIEEMGISLTDVNGVAKSQNTVLKEMAYWFSENAGEAKNAGIAARIFGENGSDMLRIFESGKDTIDSIFNAKGIDDAAAAAERFKDSMENLAQATLPTIYKYVGGIADFISQKIEPSLLFKAETKNAFSALEMPDKFKADLEKVTAQISTLEEKLSTTPKTMMSGFFGNAKFKSNPEYESIKSQIDALKERQHQLIKESAQKAKAYSEEKTYLAKQKADEEALQKTLAAQESERLRDEKTQQDALFDAVMEHSKEEEAAAQKIAKAREEAMALDNRREEFELESKIKILRAQGKDYDADQLEFAKKRNDLMREYNYSLEQATKIQKALDSAANGGKVKYSDEAQAKAREIVARGESGTIGKKTLADAQAILNGEAPEGGLQTAMFKQYNNDVKRRGEVNVRDLTVDTNTEKQSLEKEAEDLQKRSTDALSSIQSSMEQLNNTISDIKNTVDSIAVKKDTQ